MGVELARRASMQRTQIYVSKLDNWHLTSFSRVQVKVNPMAKITHCRVLGEANVARH